MQEILSECLTLQAKEQECYDKIMATILENLELLGKGELATLAKKASTEIGEISKDLKLYEVLIQNQHLHLIPIIYL